MIFNSFEFLIFIVVNLVFYSLLNRKQRWILLLFSSYFFYAWWNPAYLSLILISTLIDYLCSRKMGQLKKEKRLPYLWISILSNLAILISFKYFNFFSSVANDIANFLNLEYSVPLLNVLLPMGISFYTFQTMSFSIDVYHGKIKPEKHLGIFALYVTYFPQLVAGPIERASNLLPQLKKFDSVRFDNLKEGGKLVLLGLFKKVVIADRLALYVDQVYSSPLDYGASALLIGTLFFAFQIYCDFSGYSDIAIGVARFFNINLMKNFERPYFSTSISEFWKRWHISLSSWFKDYVYIPLGGNRVVKWKWYYNLLLTFIVSGFWHGANWTFIIWGGLHGLYLILAIMLRTSRYDKPVPWLQALNILWVFSLVLVSWIFFRAENITEAYGIINLISFNEWNLIDVFSPLGSAGNVYKFDLVLGTVLIVGLLLFEGMYHFKIGKLKVLHHPLLYSIAILLIFLLGVFESKQFIYFQF